MRRLAALSLLEQQQRASSELLDGISWAYRPASSEDPRDMPSGDVFVDDLTETYPRSQDSSRPLLFAGF